MANTQTQTQAEVTSQVQSQQSPPTKPGGEGVSGGYGSKIKLSLQKLGYDLAFLVLNVFKTVVEKGVYRFL